METNFKIFSTWQARANAVVHSTALMGILAGVGPSRARFSAGCEAIPGIGLDWLASKQHKSTFVVAPLSVRKRPSPASRAATCTGERTSKVRNQIRRSIQSNHPLILCVIGHEIPALLCTIATIVASFLEHCFANFPQHLQPQPPFH